jgi:hypothetical protein
MRYLRDYKLFESRDGLTDEQRKFLDRNTNGTWSVNSEGLVDIKGGFYCFGQGLEDFLGIGFGKVIGGFYCGGNQLRTLDGSPREVVGNFYCGKNPLISLEGAPEVIGYHFIFKNTRFSYNLPSFLNWIDRIKPDEISLLLTHHFFTVDVIQEQITKNPDFPYYVSLAWNTEGFKNKQDELKKILPENILVKIDDLWSIGGYL